MLSDINELHEKTGLWVEFSFPTKSKSKIGTTTQEKIIALIKLKPIITRKELAGKIGLSGDGIEYHLKKLRDAELIRHIGSTKAGHWEVLK